MHRSYHPPVGSIGHKLPDRLYFLLRVRFVNCNKHWALSSSTGAATMDSLRAKQVATNKANPIMFSSHGKIRIGKWHLLSPTTEHQSPQRPCYDKYLFNSNCINLLHIMLASHSRTIPYENPDSKTEKGTVKM